MSSPTPVRVVLRYLLATIAGALAATAFAQAEGVKRGSATEGPFEPQIMDVSYLYPPGFKAMLERAKDLRVAGDAAAALRIVDAYAAHHGKFQYDHESVLYGNARALSHVMLADFAAAKRALEPQILEENWGKSGPPDGVEVYILASLGLPYTDLAREYWYGPRWWTEGGRRDYIEAAWPEPTTPELVRFYAGLWVIAGSNFGTDRGTLDAIAKQLEDIWRDHPFLIERRARRYEERRMWQHAINEAQDLYRWTENPDQRGKVDSRIADYALRRDRLGGLGGLGAPPARVGYETRPVALYRLDWSWGGQCDYDQQAGWVGPSSASQSCVLGANYPIQPLWITRHDMQTAFWVP